MLPTWFKEYLSFHRSERNAIIVLVILLFTLIVFNLYQRFFWKANWEEMQLKYGPSIVQFQEEIDSISLVEASPQPWIPKTYEHFKFDPNTLDSTGWLALGFSPKQTASILKYRSKGAKFRKPEDIKNLFMVNDERYKELQPFIDIKPISDERAERKFEEYPKWEKPTYEPTIVELNTADSALLVTINGVGPSYAKRILKYREQLGGYVSKNQLFELYKIDSAHILPILQSVHVDTTIRKRINVNTADYQELLKHPYIDPNLAKTIVNYRQQHGKYKKLLELKKIQILKEDTYTKLKPYLIVE
ncbi:MAG: helix-hairpin-helix domain-containing protein [Flavobacteriales bacterium]|nr:helix-hairpin-helix domain-containing protein [Flavobacteriales bacterium]